MSTVTTAPVATSTQYLMPLNTAKSIASLIGFAASPRDYTPALQVVKVMFTSEGITARATDRYAVIEGFYANYPDTEGTIYLDAVACKFISAYKVAKGHNPMITFDVVDNELTVNVGTASTVIRMFSGNWPAVETLFDGFTPATEATPVAFKVDHLAKLGKLLDTSASKIEAWRFELGTPSTGYEGKHRPAPIRATNGTFRALIQPMLGLPE